MSHSAAAAAVAVARATRRRRRGRRRRRLRPVCCINRTGTRRSRPRQGLPPDSDVCRRVAADGSVAAAGRARHLSRWTVGSRYDGRPSRPFQQRPCKATNRCAPRVAVRARLSVRPFRVPKLLLLLLLTAG